MILHINVSLFIIRSTTEPVKTDNMVFDSGGAFPKFEAKKPWWCDQGYLSLGLTLERESLRHKLGFWVLKEVH